MGKIEDRMLKGSFFFFYVISLNEMRDVVRWFWCTHRSFISSRHSSWCCIENSTVHCSLSLSLYLSLLALKAQMAQSPFRSSLRLVDFEYNMKKKKTGEKLAHSKTQLKLPCAKMKSMFHLQRGKKKKQTKRESSKKKKVNLQFILTNVLTYGNRSSALAVRCFTPSNANSKHLKKKKRSSSSLRAIFTCYRPLFVAAPPPTPAVEALSRLLLPISSHCILLDLVH